MTYLNEPELLFAHSLVSSIAINCHNLTCHLFAHIVCYILPIERTQSGSATPRQSGSRSNGNEGVLHILEISKAGASPSDGLMSYTGHLLGTGLTPLQRCSQCIQQSHQKEVWK